MYQLGSRAEGRGRRQRSREKALPALMVAAIPAPLTPPHPGLSRPRPSSDRPLAARELADSLPGALHSEACNALGASDAAL